MKRNSGRKCSHCKELYRADRRTADRQCFCSKPECKKVSKAQSQKRWLQKPENRIHYGGSENCKHVREWRAANPGYWRRKKARCKSPLQDDCKVQPAHNQSVVVPHLFSALQ